MSALFQAQNNNKRGQPIRMDMPLASFLLQNGFEQFQPIMLAHGISWVSQLGFVCEADLQNMGMTWLQARQLKCSMPTTFGPEYFAPGFMSVETILTEHVQDCESKARDALHQCHHIAYVHGMQDQDYCIQDAMFKLDEWDDYTRGAVLAMVSCNRARTSAHRLSRDLRGALDIAYKLLRDLLVARVQISVQWSNREAFEDEMKRAHGGTVSQQVLAQFYHSHSKTITPILPSAFLSNSKSRRRAPRPPKNNSHTHAMALWQISDSESESSTTATLLPENNWESEEPESQEASGGTSSSRDWLGHLSEDGTWVPPEGMYPTSSS